MTDNQDSPQDNGPFEMGYAAWSAGATLAGNPFTEQTDADAWTEGWLAAKADKGGVGA
jgi:ribosome modulation factor